MTRGDADFTLLNTLALHLLDEGEVALTPVGLQSKVQR